MVADIGKVLLLTGVNEGILPVPVAESPMDVLLFDQLYTVPVTPPETGMIAVGTLLQVDRLAIAFTVGVGFTIIANVLGVPVQVDPPFV